MTVRELIEYLRQCDQELPVCYRCCSEQCLLDAKDIKVGELQPPRNDGWVHNQRPDKPTIKYLVLPGN